MDLAIQIHKCLTNGSDAHELLDLYNEIQDKNTLALINEFFMEQYSITPQEYISEKFQLDEVYAISSTMKYIREPSEKNFISKNLFYKKIGYSVKSRQSDSQQ